MQTLICDAVIIVVGDTVLEIDKVVKFLIIFLFDADVIGIFLKNIKNIVKGFAVMSYSLNLICDKTALAVFVNVIRTDFRNGYAPA